MDINLIIQRVAEILKETPSAEDIVKKGGNRDKRFLYLAEHMVNKSIKEDALILGKDGLGIAMVFKTNAKENNFWRDIIAEIGLAIHVTGLRNAFRILRNQQYIKKQRPKKGDYYYAWFWGIVKDDRGPNTQIASDMKNKILEMCDKNGLPLYTETRLRTNVIVYARYGFENFHTWNHPDGHTMWFLRYIPKSFKE